MKYTKEDLYALTGEEFEDFCLSNIKNIAPDVYNYEYNLDGSFDLIANNGTVAIEIKHHKSIDIDYIKIFFKLLSLTPKIKVFILITSGKLTKRADDLLKKEVEKNALSIAKIKIVDVEELITLTKNDKINIKQIKVAKKRSLTQNRILTISSFVSIISVLLLLFSFTLKIQKPTLEKKIQNVELAIGNLKDLEVQLNDIKEDMQKTQKAKKIIEQEYNKAKELEKLTEQQIESFKEAIKSQSWYDILLQNALSFILGVGSSIVATILISKYRQKKTLED